MIFLSKEVPLTLFDVNIDQLQYQVKLEHDELIRRSNSSTAIVNIKTTLDIKTNTDMQLIKKALSSDKAYVRLEIILED